jgi:hypothetical protein
MKRSIRGPVSKGLLALAVLQSVIGFSASPASAGPATRATGDLNFTGVATLPTFPCATNCQGLVKGRWFGALDGLHEDREFHFEWATVADDQTGKYHMGYNYSDTCLSAVPPSGVAVGSGTSFMGLGTAGSGEVFGTFWDLTGVALPETIDGVRMDFSYDLMREGLGFEIVLTSISFKIFIDGGETLLINSVPQFGSMTFTPMDPGSGPPNAPTCSSAYSGMTGKMTGHIGLDQVTPPV